MANGRSMKTIEGAGGGKVGKWNNVGLMVSGIHRGLRPGRDFQGQSTTLWYVEREDGTTERWGATTLIRDRLADVPIGTYVEITYKGQATKQSGVGTYKDFLVQIDADSPAGRKLPQDAPPDMPPFNLQAKVPEASASGSKLSQLEVKLVQARGAQAAQLILEAIYTGKTTDEAKAAALRDLLVANGVA